MKKALFVLQKSSCKKRNLILEILNMVSEANAEYQSAELEELIKKIAEAIKQNKWMIHYGV
ncbi:hypothetical protein MHB65_12815 [Lysinibacillus sp. FSL K6-0075]|uniref:hypothetical protein n=1 Tax=Lysinibacillus sp. FSL K6-0075 TaxID=2921415 RepID=UPI0031594A46